jgi:PST family polysaccharide transporter
MSAVERLIEDGHQGAPAIRVSVAWTSVAAVVRQATTLLALAVMARLVTPADYGLFAIASAVGAFSVLLAESGIGPAVITHRDLNATAVSTAFYLNTLAALVTAIALAAVAYPFAAVYGDPGLVPLLFMMALATALTLSVVHLALLERLRRYRLIAVLEVSATLAGQAAAVIGGLAGLGALALALAPVVTAAALTLLVAGSTRWLPRPDVSRAEARIIWRFSRPLLTFNLANYWTRNTDTLLLGKFAPAQDLGLYSRAYALMLVPIQQVSFALARVLLPYLTRHKHDLPALWLQWTLAGRTALLVGLPISAVLAVHAEEIIRLVLGPQWTAAAPILTVLGLAIPPQLLLRLSGSAYQAASIPARQLRIGLVNTGTFIIGTCCGLPWGAVGVAVGICASYYISLVVVLVDLGRRLGGSYRGLTSAIPPVVAGCAMTLVMALSRGQGSWWSTVVSIVLGCLAFVLVLLLIDPRWDVRAAREASARMWRRARAGRRP